MSDKIVGFSSQWIDSDEQVAPQKPISYGAVKPVMYMNLKLNCKCSENNYMCLLQMNSNIFCIVCCKFLMQPYSWPPHESSFMSFKKNFLEI